MKTLTTLLLTAGLCSLTLPGFAANESCDVSTDGAFNVVDIVQMVNAILGDEDDAVICGGTGCDAAVAEATSGMVTQEALNAAVAAVDISSDNQQGYDDEYAAGVASVDITSDNETVWEQAYTEGISSVDVDGIVADATAAATPSCDWYDGEVWNGQACVAGLTHNEWTCWELGNTISQLEWQMEYDLAMNGLPNFEQQMTVNLLTTIANAINCDNICPIDQPADVCGNCDGPGILEGQCDCDGNVLDACGVCGGTDTTAWEAPDLCAQPTWRCSSTNVYYSQYANPDDKCNSCAYADCPNGGWCVPTETMAIGCTGECGGPYLDCNGVCGGGAVVDGCGVCGGNDGCYDACVLTWTVTMPLGDSWEEGPCAKTQACCEANGWATIWIGSHYTCEGTPDGSIGFCGD